MKSGSLLLRLGDREAYASASERDISAFIRNDPQAVVGMSVRELASATFTSPSTVLRLCKKLGCAGYKDFQRELLYELALLGDQNDVALEDVSRNDSPEHIMRKVMKSNIRSIEATCRLLDVDTICRCVDLLKGARVVDVFGIGASRLVAHDLVQKLMRIDKECRCFDDTHDQLLCAKNIHADDIAVIFSYSGRTPEMLDCARLIVGRGAKLIAVTRMDSTSVLAQMADVVLGIAASEPIVRSGAMASRMAQLMVVDVLYASYVADDYDCATNAIKRNYIEKS